MAPFLTCFASLLALLPAALALPHPEVELKINTTNFLLPSQNLNSLQKEMPTQPGLPSNSNVTLKYVAVGVGHQNYTCNGATYIQMGGGDGALATLYDATAYFKWNKTAISTFPAERLNQYTSANQNQFHSNHNPFLPALGEHFFDTAIRPNFNLYDAHPQAYLVGVKVASAASPTAGNIAWLLLEENTSAGLTRNLNSVYRVETAGGVAPASCTSNGQSLQVPYAAEYWFFD